MRLKPKISEPNNQAKIFEFILNCRLIGEKTIMNPRAPTNRVHEKSTRGERIGIFTSTHHALEPKPYLTTITMRLPLPNEPPSDLVDLRVNRLHAANSPGQTWRSGEWWIGNPANSRHPGLENEFEPGLSPPSQFRPLKKERVKMSAVDSLPTPLGVLFRDVKRIDTYRYFLESISIDTFLWYRYPYQCLKLHIFPHNSSKVFPKNDIKKVQNFHQNA